MWHAHVHTWRANDTGITCDHHSKWSAQVTAQMNMDRTVMQLYEPTTGRCIAVIIKYGSWSEARFIRSRRQHHKRTVRKTSTQWNQSTSSCSSIHDYSQRTKFALMYWYYIIHRPYYTPFTWTHSWSGLRYWDLICYRLKMGGEFGINCSPNQSRPR